MDRIQYGHSVKITAVNVMPFNLDDSTQMEKKTKKFSMHERIENCNAFSAIVTAKKLLLEFVFYLVLHFFELLNLKNMTVQTSVQLFLHFRRCAAKTIVAALSSKSYFVFVWEYNGHNWKHIFIVCISVRKGCISYGVFFHRKMKRKCLISTAYVCTVHYIFYGFK